MIHRTTFFVLVHYRGLALQTRSYFLLLFLRFVIAWLARVYRIPITIYNLQIFCSLNDHIENDDSTTCSTYDNYRVLKYALSC